MSTSLKGVQMLSKFTKIAKAVGLEFWRFIDKGPSFRRIVMGCWLLDILVLEPIVIVLPARSWAEMHLAVCGWLLLMPMVAFQIYDFPKYRKNRRRLDAEIHDLHIKSIVLNVLIDLEMQKMSPDQRTAMLLNMPAGPKE